MEKIYNEIIEYNDKNRETEHKNLLDMVDNRIYKKYPQLKK